jgi:hypothetical protein
MATKKKPAPPAWGMATHGTLNGQQVLLATAEATLSQDDLEQVEVERGDGEGTYRPWRFSTQEWRVLPNGDIAF